MNISRLNERRHSTGMFLIEVGLLNGYTVDMPQEEQRNPMAKLIELNENTVNFYYDQVCGHFNRKALLIT